MHTKYVSTVTGPLTESQIAYVTRETLQVSHFNGLCFDNQSYLLMTMKAAFEFLMVEMLTDISYSPFSKKQFVIVFLRLLWMKISVCVFAFRVYITYTTKERYTET